MSNATLHGCPILKQLPADPVPLFSNGNINFKAHDVGWMVTGIVSIVAICASFWLILKHLRFFYSPSQQRHIVRILLMVPIYSVSSFLSYFYYEEALYFQLGRDCYEALVINSFFHLLLSYLSSPPPSPGNPCPQPYATREERAQALKEVFENVKVGKWMFPFGAVKWRPAGGGPGEGEAFLWLMRIGIGQYVILRPLSTLVAVISQALGYYCLNSWSPKFLHLYTSTIVSISVSIAMYCVLQLYWPVKKELEPYRPVMKFLSVKSVVFLTFWQETVLGLFETFGWIKDHQYWTAAEIVIGLSALLSCFEMMCFGFIHITAFTYLPYRALAPLCPISGDFDDSEPLIVPKSFEDWSELEKQKAQEAILESRLAPLPDAKKHLRTKVDGQPLPRQTKKLPALWKCIKLSDVAREIGEEAKFVVARKKPGEKAVDRTQAMSHVFGQSRMKVAKGMGGGDRWEGEEGEDRDGRTLEERLRHLRERGEDVPPKDDPKSWPYREMPLHRTPPSTFSNRGDPENMRQLLEGDPSQANLRLKDERSGWWNSVKSNMFGAAPGRGEEQFEEFVTLERPNLSPIPRKSSFSNRRRPDLESKFIPPSQRLAGGTQNTSVINPALVSRTSRQPAPPPPSRQPVPPPPSHRQSKTPALRPVDSAEALEHMPTVDFFGNLNIPPAHLFSEDHPGSQFGGRERRHSHSIVHQEQLQESSFRASPMIRSPNMRRPPPARASHRTTTSDPPPLSKYHRTESWTQAVRNKEYANQSRGLPPGAARPAPPSSGSRSGGFVFEEY